VLLGCAEPVVGVAGERDVAHLAVTGPPRCQRRSCGLAGHQRVAAAGGLAHHREGGVLVGLEGLQRVGDEEQFASIDGQGTITFSGPAFSSFTFSHNQGFQAGFVIERILVNTGDSQHVPEPGTLALIGLALVGLAASRKRAR
jgi:hypothetical protein